jgi:hypothetical protein
MARLSDHERGFFHCAKIRGIPASRQAKGQREVITILAPLPPTLGFMPASAQAAPFPAVFGGGD